jgi:hypothetical protein
MKIERIISGGQTGADRAALDWAIRHGITHGGWCPKGRRALDGVIADCYQLQEATSKDYVQRTKLNVRDSDATLVITLKSELTGGSLLTLNHAKKIGKPCLHLHPGIEWREALREFLTEKSICVLNVAGSRGSSAKGIEQFVDEVLNGVHSHHLFQEA